MNSKNIPILFLLFAACGIVGFGQIKSDREQRSYRGHVREVRTETSSYSLMAGKLKSGTRKVRSVDRFDRAGNILEAIYYSGSTGEILWREKSTYSKGRIVETAVQHSPFVYFPDRRVYRYDERGNVIEEKGFDLRGKLVDHSTYEFDDKNRKIRWSSMSYHPEALSKPYSSTYTYDEQNRVKEEKAYSDDGSGYAPTDSFGGPHRKLYIYRGSGTKPGNILLFNKLGSFVGMSSIVYDARGNELEDISYDLNGNLKEKTRYLYIFDQLGNWVVQRTYEWTSERGKRFYRPTDVDYRIISFYR